MTPRQQSDRAKAAGTKSGRKSGNATTFKKGHDPRRGRGPKKGAPNAGAPPLAFADECRRLQAGSILEKCREAIETLPVASPAYQWAATWISRYGHSDAARRVSISIDEAESLADDVLDAVLGDDDA